jgi:OFA family oxalate/formate antiporter-like MFS transporter
MTSRTMNRWVVVAGGILVQLCLGAIYAWSAFTRRLTLEPFEFSAAQTQIVFAVGLACFATSMALVAGRWQARVGPRRVALTGGLVLGLGYLLAGFAPNGPGAFWVILLGVGVLGGCGIGLAYVCPIAALVKWFPDKKGFITGLAVAGFGFGALIWVKLTGGFQFGPIDLTPGWDGLYGDGWSVQAIFRLYGVLFAVLVGLGGLVMVNPPEGFVPRGWTPPPATSASGGVDFTVRQMVRTPQYWALFSTFAFTATAGLMVIGVIRLFGVDALTANDIPEADAAVMTGTAMGLFLAIFNGIGRIAWGTISDKIGRKESIIVMCLAQAAIMVVFKPLGATEWGLYVGAAIIGFNFGGNFALFPAATADLFGNKNVGSNYPWIFLAYGVGGIVGPILGGRMGDAHAWLWAFVPAGVVCLAGAAVTILVLKPPRAPAPAPESRSHSNLRPTEDAPPESSRELVEQSS